MTTLQSIPQPSRGGTYQDPAYGTKISRLTGPEDGNMCSVAYSYYPTANCNSTRLVLVIDSVATLFDFDPANMKATNRGPLFASDPMQFEGLSWSVNNPDVIYGLSGYRSATRLRGYNVATKQPVFEYDFTAAGILPPGNPWQMSKSRSSDINFSFGWRPDENSAYKYAVVFNLLDRKTYKLDLLANNIPDFNECRLDRTGDCLVIIDDKGQQHFWRFESNDRPITVASNALERASGHYDLGQGILVQPDIWGSNGNRIIKRFVSSPHQWVELYDSKVKDWLQSHHISLLGPSDEWALVSSESSRPDYSLPAMNMLFLVRTDGSGQTKFICHHRSSCGDYLRSPHGNLSPNGRFIFWNSDWQQPGGRLDVYAAALPPSLYSASVTPTAPIPTPAPAPTPQPQPTPTPAPVVKPPSVVKVWKPDAAVRKFKQGAYAEEIAREFGVTSEKVQDAIRERMLK